MIRFSRTIFVTAALALTITSCRQPFIEGSGNSATETRQLGGSVSEIDISAPVDAEIDIVPGAAPSVSFSGYANVLPYIKTGVEDGQLSIEVKDEVNLHTDKNIIAHITLPSLNALSISGASDAKITGDITGPKMELELNGGGAINIASLHAEELSADINGAADITIQSGATTTAGYDISGTGKIHAFNLQTANTNLEIAGTGSADINAGTALDVSISGAGTVRYKGTPTITKDISGAGSVVPVE